MKNSFLHIVDCIITDYAKNRQRYLNKLNSTVYDITNIQLQNQNNFQNLFQVSSLYLVNDLLEIDKQSRVKNMESSCDFNMLELFDIGENQHSYLLAYFLNPNAAHGQGHLFLNIFLDLLKIERFHDQENWIVTVEKGRIDILLKRLHPHSVIVIENKSNYAPDQNHQLYRYWYQEIFRSICERQLPKEYIINPPERFYQLLYLSPDYWKIPNTNTLKKPCEWDEDLPNTVPLNAKHLLFSDFVCKWLTSALELLPKNNHRIREYVNQYIEYWN